MFILKKFLFLTIIILLFSLPFFQLLAQTQEPEPEPGGSYLEGLEDIQQKVGGELMPASDPILVIVRIVNYILTLVGVIFIIMIIYGGIVWMTAGANEEKIKKGKGIFKMAVIGLAIVVLARVIDLFIEDRLAAFTK